jgi:ABC-2 type transport system ATP-binding protein
LVRTPSPEPLTHILESAGATVQIREHGALLVSGLPISDIGDRACEAGIALHELSAESGSLEDLFLGWTGDARAGDVPDQPGAAESEVAQE